MCVRFSQTFVATLAFAVGIGCGSSETESGANTGGTGGGAVEDGAAGTAGTTGCAQVEAETRKDVAYATVAGVDPNLLSLDVYSPASNDSCAKLPIVIWVHGGAWFTGDKAGKLNDKIALFNGAGWVLVSANYRLSPQPPSTDPNRVMHPTHAIDVAAAVHWVKSHAAELRGDTSRIALLGHSAGAHLVALLSTDESFLATH